MDISESESGGLDETPPPTYDSIFKRTSSPAPSEPSVRSCGDGQDLANLRSTGSVRTTDSTVVQAQIRTGLDYDPSAWYFEEGKNPLKYIQGHKINHPFTDSLRKLRSKDDQSRLREISLRLV